MKGKGREEREGEEGEGGKGKGPPTFQYLPRSMGVLSQCLECDMSV